MKDYDDPGITAGCHNYERTCCSFALNVPIWWVNTRELQRKIYIPMGAINPIDNIYYGPDISVPSPHTQVSIISCYWKMRLREVPSLHMFTPRFRPAFLAPWRYYAFSSITGPWSFAKERGPLIMREALLRGNIWIILYEVNGSWTMEGSFPSLGPNMSLFSYLANKGSSRKIPASPSTNLWDVEVLDILFITLLFFFKQKWSPTSRRGGQWES